MFCRKVSDLCGQMSGYDRMGIRGKSRNHVRLQFKDVEHLSQDLFDHRVRCSAKLFPSYMAKASNGLDRQLSDGGRILSASLPVWTREDQRGIMAGMTEPPIARSFLHSTGGSTGVPLQFYMTRESYEWRMAVSNRGYSWAQAEEGRKSYYVWGTPISKPGFLAGVKVGLSHMLQRRKYFDSFVFDDSRKLQCCNEIERYKPVAIVGYAGNLVELARFVRDNPDALKWRSRTVVSAAEGLLPGQRELIEEYLGQELFMSYGSREFMLIGMECSEHNGYHLSSDNLYVEVVDDDGQPVGEGEKGRIVITDLHNDANPFVRYEIGDIGTYTSMQCPCGLPFPLLASVDGRVQEVIVKHDGSKMTALFLPHLMKEFDWVEGYQVRQERNGEIDVCFVTSIKLTPELESPIRAVLQSKLGEEMIITFSVVDALTKSKSGKTPIVISSIE